uniref:DNA replication protein n=1 Tax=Klebsiella pneumoniae TaxID=573 RepID=A0A8B0ST42_KLEPN|nr:DNA replication protein [Klebsiella pneumoniae]
MTSENNSLLLNLQEVDKTTGEVVKLDVNSTSTVQPVALMRLGLFVPTLKSTGKSKANRKKTLQTRLRSLYSCPLPKAKDTLTLRSPVRVLIWTRIFKVWLGIIRSMSEYGVKSDTTELSFVEFVKMCGFDSRRSNKKMRDRISNSLFKLASVTLKFQSETKGWTTHLVQSAYYDINEDIVEIKAEPKLFELLPHGQKGTAAAESH